MHPGASTAAVAWPDVQLVSLFALQGDFHEQSACERYSWRRIKEDAHA